MIRSSKSSPGSPSYSSPNTAQAIYPAALHSESKQRELKTSKKAMVALKKSTTSQDSKPKATSSKKVLMKDGKPAVSFASVAQAKERVKAYASMARKGEQVPPTEGDLPDIYDVNPPPLYDDQVIANPNARIAIYEEEVVLDSGATDNMVPSFSFLALIMTAFHLVTLADGTLHESNYQGLMRIALRCIHSGERHIVPMRNPWQSLLLHQAMMTCTANPIRTTN